MRVLVTGAAGQLGTALRHADAGDFTFIWTDITGQEMLPLDITEPTAVDAFVEEHEIDAVVNCAGFTNVDAAENSSSSALALNATAVVNLASAMKRRGGLIVHISTDYIFGGEPHTEPIPEWEKPSPISVYGITKLRGEEAVKASGARYVILRTAWMYSPWGRNFVKTILNLSADRDLLRVVCDQVGSPTYAPDLASMIITVLSSYRDGTLVDDTYNYTGEGSCSWYQFACEIVRLSGNTQCTVTPCKTGEYPAKAARPAYSVLDKTLVKETFGIEIPQWEDSLRRCISAILES